MLNKYEKGNAEKALNKLKETIEDSIKDLEEQIGSKMPKDKRKTLVRNRYLGKLRGSASQQYKNDCWDYIKDELEYLWK